MPLILFPELMGLQEVEFEVCSPVWGPVLIQLLPRGSAVTPPPPDTHLLSTCGPSRYGEGLPASPQFFQPLLRPSSTPDLPGPSDGPLPGQGSHLPGIPGLIGVLAGLPVEGIPERK